MFDRLLPQRVDNTYGGDKLALWLFALVVLVKIAISLGCIFNGYRAATTADEIPLDTFPQVGAQAVVSLFALWGLAQLMIGMVCILALIRYRSLIPLMFALLLVEHLGRKTILLALPIAQTGTPPPGTIINLALLTAMIVGLILSLRRQGRVQPQG